MSNVDSIIQPGPDAVGIVAISHGCPGVAARACGLIGLEPSKVLSPQRSEDKFCGDFCAVLSKRKKPVNTLVFIYCEILRRI